jgi:hypothetical protein
LSQARWPYDLLGQFAHRVPGFVAQHGKAIRGAVTSFLVRSSAIGGGKWAPRE